MVRNLFIGEENELQRKAGEYIARIVGNNPSVKLGGATGRSPVVSYGTALSSGVDFRDVEIYFLDEYFGFFGIGSDGMPTSYRGFANYHLHVKPVSMGLSENRVFQLENIHVPLGNFHQGDRLVTSKALDKILLENPKDFEFRGLETEETDEKGLLDRYGIKTPLETQAIDGKTLRRFVPEISIKENAKNPILRKIKEANELYDKRVIDGKVALQILGLGREAHIAFNEAGTLEDSITHLTALAFSTLDANESDYSGGESTWYAVTQGIKTVLNAKELMLLAFGEKKAKAVCDMLFKESHPFYPAAYIQNHENVRLYLNREALEKCEKECKNKGLTLEQGLENKGWSLQ